MNQCAGATEWIFATSTLIKGTCLRVPVCSHHGSCAHPLFHTDFQRIDPETDIEVHAVVSRQVGWPTQFNGAGTVLKRICVM